MEPEIDGEQVKMLARAVQPIDGAVKDAAPAGLKIYVNEIRAFESIAKRLADTGGGRGGPVNLVMTIPELDKEAEIALPGEYPVTPAIKGAIKAATGVLHVEEF